MDGTEGLTDGEYRAYDVVCNLIYLNDGPIVLHEAGIAGRCRQHVLAFRKNFRSLVEKGKLIVEDGKVSNKRASSELDRIRTKRRKPPADPRPTPGQPPHSRADIGKESGAGPASKPLKNKEPTMFDVAPEKRREENKDTEANASAAAPTQAELERQLFQRGKSVLGKNAGGMISTLLKSREFDVALARSVIETAATKQDAREYVAAAIKNGGQHGADRGTRPAGGGRIAGAATEALKRFGEAGRG